MNKCWTISSLSMTIILTWKWRTCFYLKCSCCPTLRKTKLLHIISYILHMFEIFNISLPCKSTLLDRLSLKFLFKSRIFIVVRCAHQYPLLVEYINKIMHPSKMDAMETWFIFLHSRSLEILLYIPYEVL